jgi:hypothetical protein
MNGCAVPPRVILYKLAESSSPCVRRISNFCKQPLPLMVGAFCFLAAPELIRQEAF